MDGVRFDVGRGEKEAWRRREVDDLRWMETRGLGAREGEQAGMLRSRVSKPGPATEEEKGDQREQTMRMSGSRQAVNQSVTPPVRSNGQSVGKSVKQGRQIGEWSVTH